MNVAHPDERTRETEDQGTEGSSRSDQSRASVPAEGLPSPDSGSDPKIINK